MKGYRKREYTALISLDYFQENARRTEREMGWGRVCIQKGIKEKETGTEDKMSNLSEDIRSSADLQTQADPSMKSGSLTYGPNSLGRRTQFIKRMTEISDRYNLKVRLIYYPPYHSKYNPIERCRGRLEEHWNGEILNSVEKAIERAETMTWKGIKPVVHLCKKVYKNGVKLTEKEMKPYEERIVRSSLLPKWDVTIAPLDG